MNIFRINPEVLILLSVFILAGCENLFQSKPEDILLKYLKADLVGDHNKAYYYLSSRDKRKKSLQQYIGDQSKNDGSELIKLLIDKTKFKILNEQLNGNVARVEVETTTVDVNIITNEFANAALHADNGKSFENIQREIAKKYKKEGLPLNTYKSSYNLVKENNKWKVLLNL